MCLKNEVASVYMRMSWIHKMSSIAQFLTSKQVKTNNENQWKAAPQKIDEEDKPWT